MVGNRQERESAHISAMCLCTDAERSRTGLMRSRSHQTISEHWRGSGAMMSMGSARTRHSQSDQREGKKVEKARRGDEPGKEASIWSNLSFRPTANTLTECELTESGASGCGRFASFVT